MGSHTVRAQEAWLSHQGGGRQRSCLRLPNKYPQDPKQILLKGRRALGTEKKPENVSVTFVLCPSATDVTPVCGKLLPSSASISLSPEGHQYALPRGMGGGGVVSFLNSSSGEAPPDHGQEGNEMQQFNCIQSLARAMEVCHRHTSPTGQALSAGTFWKKRWGQLS